MDELFSTDPGTYLTLKGTLHSMRKGRVSHHLCGAQEVWGMTTILLSMGCALSVNEMIRSAQAGIRSPDEI
jgi:hypothetical protein